MQDTDLREITTPITPPPRRNRMVMWLVGGSAIVIGLAIAIVVFTGEDTDSEAEAATSPTTAASTTSESTTTVAETPATAAPGTTVAAADPTQVWPPPRYMMSVAFDEQSDLLVVFGGTRSEEAGLSETWVFDPESKKWTEQNPETRPGVRMSASMAYDPGLDRLVLFGGLADLSYVWDDLWLYDVDSDSWEQVQVEGPRPPARHAAAMTYVDSLGGMLLFGGNDRHMLGQGLLVDNAWFLDTATMTWTEIEGPGPGMRDLAGMAYDPIEDVVLFAGGWTDDYRTWRFDPTTLEWTAGAEVETPTSRLSYDPVGNRIVTGGAAYSTQDDTWSTLPWDQNMRDDGYLGVGPVLDSRRGVMYFFDFGFRNPRWAMYMWEYDLETGEFTFLGPE